MILCDRDIKKRLANGDLVVTSDKASEEILKQVHASSMDIRLGNNFKLYKHAEVALLDPRNPNGFSDNIHKLHEHHNRFMRAIPGHYYKLAEPLGNIRAVRTHRTD